MIDRIWPPDWHFSERSNVQHIVIGDMLPVDVEPSDVDAPSCLNCRDIELVFARKVTRSGPVTWIGGKRFHASLISAPCPVCRGEHLQEWLKHNCGLEGMEFDGKPALEIRVTDETPLKGQEEAFDVAWSLLAGIPDEHSWALFTGDYGRGKSHILVGLVNGCRLAGVYALYTKSEVILSTLRSTFEQDAGKTTDEIRRRFEQVPILVVDELDRVKWTEWAGEQLFAILNTRYDHGRPTWLASNLGPGALSKKSEPLAALVSRMSAGKMVVVGGADLRPMKQDQLDLAAVAE